MVLVQISTTSAPPRSSRCAASIIRLGRRVPAARVLERLDLAEVEGPQEAARGAQAAQPCADGLVDEAVYSAELSQLMPPIRPTALLRHASLQLPAYMEDDRRCSASSAATVVLCCATCPTLDRSV